MGKEKKKEKELKTPAFASKFTKLFAEGLENERKKNEAAAKSGKKTPASEMLEETVHAEDKHFG